MSFKEETEFNMLKSKGNGSQSLKNHVVKTKSGIDVLKTAAIYGANAAGKSNLVKAIAFLKSIVVDGTEILVPQSKRFRLDKNYLNKSSIFRIEYEYKNIHFDYAVEIYKGKIIEEWLYIITSVSKNKEQLLFKRIDDIVEFGEYFENKNEVDFALKFLKKQLIETETVLKTCYLLFDENNILDIICEAFTKIIIINPDTFDSDYTSDILSNQKPILFTKELLLNSKTGIEELIIEHTKADLYFGYDDSDLKNRLIDMLENSTSIDKKQNSKLCITFLRKGSYNAFIKENNEYFVLVLKTKHFDSENLFDFDEESDGTNRLFELSPAFEQLLSTDEIVYVIDELERSMHPLLAKELLKMYSKNSTSKSQLIFTTHESHLLDDDLLRRDEIWFTEKKLDGSTEFYPLSNFNPRGDKVLERGYLQGRYGGIPFLGDFSKLIVEENLV